MKTLANKWDDSEQRSGMKEKENTGEITGTQTNQANARQRGWKHKDDNGERTEEEGRQLNQWRRQKRGAAINKSQTKSEMDG